jgi:polysaccharide export outer membrane protein
MAVIAMNLFNGRLIRTLRMLLAWAAVAAAAPLSHAADIPMGGQSMSGASQQLQIYNTLNTQGFSVAEQGDMADYKIGPSNLLEIKVKQDATFDRLLRVDGRGEITLPLIGAIRVTGMTAQQIEMEIAARLKAKYIRDPDVIVFIREFTQIKFVVQGMVQRPGIYNAMNSISLLEALAMAGGPSERAETTNVKIVRANRLRDTHAINDAEVFNLDKIRAGEQLDTLVNAGDNVFIEEAVPIIIEGAVQRPGIIYPKSHTTLMQLVSMAGGLRELGDGTSVKVYTPAENGSKQEKVYNLEKIREGKELDPPLKPGHVVVVEEAGGRALLYGIGRFFRSLLRFSPITLN